MAASDGAVGEWRVPKLDLTINRRVGGLSWRRWIMVGPGHVARPSRSSDQDAGHRPTPTRLDLAAGAHSTRAD
jgi:hypothetical protein